MCRNIETCICPLRAASFKKQGDAYYVNTKLQASGLIAKEIWSQINKSSVKTFSNKDRTVELL
jgi:hypothetical protein